MASLSFGDLAGRAAWRLVPQRTVSHIIGWWGARPIAAPRREATLAGFVRRFGIDPAEADGPVAGYASRDAFFTRRLRPGARPLDATPGAVVNPADGTVVESGLAEEGKLIQAKGVRFTLADLLGDQDLAARLGGGAYVITYLSPRDYHRVHAPVAGAVVAWHHIPGTLFSVDPGSVRREPGLFARNERLVTVIDSEAGPCAVVMVAAIGVGHITAGYDDDVRTHAAGFSNGRVRSKRLDPPRPIARGDEIGAFHLGSTTIAVFAPGRVVLDPLAPGAATRMGTRIGRILPVSQ